MSVDVLTVTNILPIKGEQTGQGNRRLGIVSHKQGRIQL